MFLFLFSAFLVFLVGFLSSAFLRFLARFLCFFLVCFYHFLMFLFLFSAFLVFLVGFLCFFLVGVLCFLMILFLLSLPKFFCLNLFDENCLRTLFYFEVFLLEYQSFHQVVEHFHLPADLFWLFLK